MPTSCLKYVGCIDTLGRAKNPYNIFINLDGSIEMAVCSKKPRGVALVKWLIKKSIKKIQEENEQAIEEKDAAIPLLNDDLQKREYENVALQAQKDVYQAELQKCQDIIAHLETRYNPHAKKTW